MTHSELLFVAFQCQYFSKNVFTISSAFTASQSKTTDIRFDRECHHESFTATTRLHESTGSSPFARASHLIGSTRRSCASASTSSPFPSKYSADQSFGVRQFSRRGRRHAASEDTRNTTETRRTSDLLASGMARTRKRHDVDRSRPR